MRSIRLANSSRAGGRVDRSTRLGQGLRLDLGYPQHEPRRFGGDPVRVRQIVLNFVSDAVKFTGAGSVRVSVSFAAATETGEVPVRIAVSDTGIGIPEEAQARLFAKFTQADNSTTRVYGGSGLGLAISKRLAELMGGSVGLSSRLGAGSTFWVSLPLGMAEEPMHSPRQNVEKNRGEKTIVSLLNIGERRAGIHILLAEDNIMNQKISVALLSKLSCTLVVAANGEEALGHWSSGEFDCVLMDCQMPKRDGYETAKAIRLRENGGPRTLIIALTANAMVGDRERCIAAGMDDYLTKPLRVEELARALEKWFPERCGTALSNENAPPVIA